MSIEVSNGNPLYIVVAHNDSQIGHNLKSKLRELGHDTSNLIESGPELEEFMHANTVDVVLTSVDLPDKNGLDVLIDVGKQKAIPAIVITPERSLVIVEKALEDHVMAYMVEPVEIEEIAPTIHLVLKRFEQLQQLEQEADSLKQALEQRKVIERAKGILMASEELNEAEAHRELQKRAKDSRRKLVDVANDIIESVSKK
ncbi:ANTAR domain-containing response regulator [Calycomorphotria hydatis]|uniref:Putative transcriptional regulatory protein pdtaR n=1 Tax=Calycomorphotria hydatis TaxID=2528027 RepID=A0A517T644_9PLAN|nr:ANTAR domain-containing protein [Calycomorphotria hydatis]QDT63847.1 putative transcriptional regulatory protein pdtaR [Calycomorphotria hydatis]